MTRLTGSPLRIGVIGCGSISVAYMRNAPLFAGVKITACADLNPQAAALRAREYGLRAMDVDGIMTDQPLLLESVLAQPPGERSCD